jgi:hypothetical protein
MLERCLVNEFGLTRASAKTGILPENLSRSMTLSRFLLTLEMVAAAMPLNGTVIRRLVGIQNGPIGIGAACASSVG